MAGRPNNTNGELLVRMTQILKNLVCDRGNEPIEYRGLSAFTKHHPPKFEGKFNPEGAQRWITEIEKIFNAMGCHEEHKVTYATYMLTEEAENWWRVVNQTLPHEGGIVSWEDFKASFLENYFPKDLKKQKAREFLELKQGNMSIGEYASKFHELMKYWPHHQNNGEELCARFENGLRADVRTTVSIFQITDLSTLVSKCRIYESSLKRKDVDTRIGGPMRTDKKYQVHVNKKPYHRPNTFHLGGTTNRNGNNNVNNDIKCYHCGGPHLRRDCSQIFPSCSHCGKAGHLASNYWLAQQKVDIAMGILKSHIIMALNQNFKGKFSP
ncbi:uncharacterized protein LOC114194909 [Vigna unguiculata]|uniref:uncharacterized protein LOC114194909 n=1 Tax=Vigna unguiculata TaxID=3917 RepID=UPI0010162330|nr:uncharacterized protein LOC114194909 [Vigna unguiculata]